MNRINMQYQWDTGSTCSMVGEEGYHQLGFPKYHPMTTSLMAYGRKLLKVNVSLMSKLENKYEQNYH